MIEIDIPTIDPIQHEPKIFFGLTSRQCLCIVPGLAIGITLFVAINKFSMDLAVILTGLAIVPAVCMGWLRPYNMKFEQYVKLVYFNTFVSNPKRIYKTDNAEDVKMRTIKERQEQEKKKKVSDMENKKKAKNKKNGEEL